MTQPAEAQPASGPGSQPVVRPDPIIRVDQIGWVIFDKANLDESRRFLEDFGLVAHAADTATPASPERYFRGTGPLPYCYIQRPASESAFVGTGFLAASREDLDRLADATGVQVTTLNRPGGGDCVRLHDPQGFVVEVVHGIEPVEPLPTRAEPLPLNTPFEKPRVNSTQRAPLEPSAVVRLGHCVVQSTDFTGTAQWYMRHLGLIPSDVQALPDGRPVIAFMRTDRGETPSDHHAFAIGIGFKNTFAHCAFEVIDIDSLGQGQQVLKRAGWTHSWGIGRHILGSQLFDYWRDGDGHEMEHYADGDVFLADYPTQYSDFGRRHLWQWGVDLPGDFGPRKDIGLLRDIAREIRAGRTGLAAVGRLVKAAAKAPRPWIR